MPLNLAPLLAEVTANRAYWAGVPANDPELIAYARMLAGDGITTSSLVSEFDPIRQHQTSAQCLLSARKYTFDKEFSKRAFKGDRFETGLRGLQAQLSLDFLDRFVDRLADSEYDCDPYQDVLCEEYGIGPGCGDDPVLAPDGDSPNDPLPRPASNPSGGPNNWITGMGSVQPPGGSLAGSAGGGGPDALRGGSLGLQSAPVPYERGRYTVRLMNGASIWPFATEIAPDGYFYIPAIPNGVTMTLYISDMQTFQECTLEVTGRTVGSSSAVYVDLPSCLEGDPIDPDEYTIVWLGLQVPRSWSTAANWEPARVPNENDDVLIPLTTNEVWLPSGAVNVRSIDSRGILRTQSPQGTQLSASGNIKLNWLSVGSGNNTFTAGGDFTYRGLWVFGDYDLPASVTTVEKLQLDGFGRLRFDHTLAVTESLVINGGGRLEGAGRTVLMPSASGSGNATINDSHTLEIRSTYETASNINTQGNGRLHIAVGGTLLIGTSTNFSGTTPLGVLNEGLILVTNQAASPGHVASCWDNRGTIRIASGSKFASSTQSCGATHNYGVIEGEDAFEWLHYVQGYTAPIHHAGATINVANVRLQSVLSGGIVLQGTITAEALEFSNGVFNISGNIQAGSLQTHRPASDGNVTINSTAATTVTDFISFGNTLLTGTGTTTLATGGTMTWAQNTTRTISGGHTLIDNGTATWGPMSQYQTNIAVDSTFRNNGTFIVQNDRPIAGAGRFRNFGTLTKTTAGASTWTVCVVQEPGGSYVPNPGTIAFTGSCP